MKIIGFTQLHNELSNGNLQGWYDSLDPICDQIFVYDQGSTDGSRDFYRDHPKIKVILSGRNDFANEIACKQMLLELVHKTNPDTDAIIWLDGDSYLTGDFADKASIDDQLSASFSEGVHAVRLPHFNLWRSDIHHRVDNKFWFQNGVIAIWKYHKELSYNVASGLHRSQIPQQIKTSKFWRNPTTSIETVTSGIIHRGFATDESIIRKYKTYYQNGQSGWRQARLILEDSLHTVRLERAVFPAWYDVKHVTKPELLVPLIVKYPDVMYNE